MKDSLVTTGLPPEDEFEDWCDANGGSFDDGVHSMRCEFDNDSVRMGVRPQSGPWVGSEDSSISLHPMTSEQKVFFDEHLVIVEDGSQGHLGDYIKIQ